MDHPKRQLLRDWWRAPRVLGHLAVRPQDIVPYARFGALTKKSPLDLRMPWWSFGAVSYMSRRLTPEMDVFEYGSGGSTVFLGARTRSVVAVEDEEPWTRAVRSTAEALGLANVSVLHRPYDFWNTDHFSSSEYLHAIDAGTYDVIVVDGKEWTSPVRDLCFWHAEHFIRKGGCIVLDDAWRYPQVKAKNRARHWKEFRGVGYCRVGVTSTTVFEY